MNYMNKEKTLRLVIILLSLSHVAILSAQAPGRCIIEAKEYPGKDPLMWDALYAAKNGIVYSGLCTEGGSAHLYAYDPSTAKNTLLYDIAEFLGETGKGIRTSGKIHNKPVEDNDGNIYFVPINNGAGPQTIDYTSWRGGNWMKYIPSTGKLENLGTVDDGLYPLTIDKKRNFLFGINFSGYFYRFDLSNNIIKNFGRVSNWDICRNIFCDDAGNVYGSFPTGRIWKYDAALEKVVDLSVTIPYDPTIYPVELKKPMIDRTYEWRSILWDSSENAAYGITTGSGSILFKFDPSEGKEGKITKLAKMCDSRFLNDDRKDIPFSTLAFTADNKNKIIYFVPSAREFDIENPDETYGSENTSHLIVYDRALAVRKDLGALQTKDGLRVFGCEGASVGPDGTLYICGQVEVDNPQKATSYVGNIPVSLQLIIYKPEIK